MEAGENPNSIFSLSTSERSHSKNEDVFSNQQVKVSTEPLSSSMIIQCNEDADTVSGNSSADLRQYLVGLEGLPSTSVAGDSSELHSTVQETISGNSLEDLLESLSEEPHEANEGAGASETASYQTIQIPLDGGGHQQIFLVQGAGGQLEPVVKSGTSQQSEQQMLIPIQSEMEPLQAGNTVLLPVIPTLMPDGRIEMRLAANALSLTSSQLIGSSADPAKNTVVVLHSSSRPEPAIAVESAASILPPELTEQLRRDLEKPKTLRLFKCQFCDYSNPRRYLLARHMKSHSEERPHKCHVCDRRFKTTSSLQNHINTHTGVKPFRCRLCTSCFTTSGEMVRHMRYKHTLEKPHKCPDCGYATVELSKLKRHVRSHTGERPFKCQYCEYSSPDTYKLKRHMRIHTGEKPYECDVCLARFTQSNSLKAHRLTHTPEEKPVFQCEFCPTTCGRKTDLRIHVVKLHTAVQPLPCNKCGKSFPDRYSLKQHARTHDGHKCFVCPHCPYAAYVQRHLEQHVLIHSDEKPFQCPEEGCAREFRQLSQLRRHQNLRHNPFYVRRSADKQHVCNLCQRRFRHKGNLKRHLDAHGDGGKLEESDYEGEEDNDKEAESLVIVDVVEEEDSKKNIVAVNPPPVVVARRKKKRKSRAPRPRLEDLGLTNVRTRGRPRKAKAPPDPDDGLETLTPSQKRAMEIEKDVELGFGFAEVLPAPHPEPAQSAKTPSPTSMLNEDDFI